jgi:thiamine-phosphate diphosphorylase
MRPVICLITDGQLAAQRRPDALAGRAAAAARAGVDLIQVREHGVDDRLLVAAVRACVTAVGGTRTRVVVNDRLDVALAANAHGVHLRSDSYAAARVRRIAPAGFLVGRSIHGVEDAIAAGRAVDYVIFGTVFATASKRGRTPAGPVALQDAVRATPIPVLAVGGVTIATARVVAGADAAGIAAIGMFAECALDALPLLVESLARAFDAPQRPPLT